VSVAQVYQANVQALIPDTARRRLEEALWADTAFLAALGVMDYSLLVGIDRDASQLVVGIIDFVRQVRLAAPPFA